MSNISLATNEASDYQGRAVVLAFTEDGAAKLFPALLSEDICQTLLQFEIDRGNHSVLMPISFTIAASEIKAALPVCPSAQKHSKSLQQRRS